MDASSKYAIGNVLLGLLLHTCEIEPSVAFSSPRVVGLPIPDEYVVPSCLLNPNPIPNPIPNPNPNPNPPTRKKATEAECHASSHAAIA